MASLFLPLAIFFSVTLSATSASAQSDEAKKKATEYYNQGTTQFKLGNFDEAIDLFKKAYETSPHHAFLFNLGQAYRQKGDCKQAIFFYRGYLAEAGAQAKNRELVEGHIKELTELCAAQEDNKNKPPDGALSPSDTGKDKDRDAADSKDETASTDVATADEPRVETHSAVRGGVHDTLTPWQPSLLSATVTAGPALLDFGGAVQVSGAQPSIGISAGYPLHFGKVGVTVGALFGYIPLSWEVDGQSGTTAFASALINVGVRYWVMDKLAVGLDAGIGGLFLMGLEPGDLFLPVGEMGGTRSKLNVRAGLAADYLITDNLMVSAAPLVFSMSPVSDGFRDEVTSLSRIEFMVGVGYRL